MEPASALAAGVCYSAAQRADAGLSGSVALLYLKQPDAFPREAARRA